MTDTHPAILRWNATAEPVRNSDEWDGPVLASGDALTAALEAEVKARREAEAALDRLDRDGHQWSRRPCPTCCFVTVALGRPFGCDRMGERTVEWARVYTAGVEKRRAGRAPGERR